MNILLDTHVLIWALENNPTLSDDAGNAITEGSNCVFVSSATVWEINIKKSIGKLDVPDNLLDEMKSHPFTLLDINFDHAEFSGKLPYIHKDPFDRMLIAQATIGKLVLVTRDNFIAKYNVNVLRA